MNLMELTGYESGVVLFGDEHTGFEGFAVNWSSIKGIPRLFAGAFIGLNDGDDLEPTNLTKYERNIAIAFAKNEGDKNPKIARSWRNEKVTIVTYEGWN